MPTISFKVSVEEARELRRRVRAEKTTLSDYLRKSALGAKPARRRRMVIKKHPVSGLPYDAAGDGLPTVTREEIAAALAEFP
ncbi:MAG: plasmid mobilization protein [Opitutaceae bacterium]